MGSASERAAWRLASRYSALGIEMVAALVFAVMTGAWLDDRYGSSPWGLLAGFTVGCGAAVLTLARLLRLARADAR